MNTEKTQSAQDLFGESNIPPLAVMLFLFASLAFLYVFDGDHKERYAANAIIDQSVKEHLSVWSQNQPDNELANGTVNRYYDCLRMKGAGLLSPPIPFFCMPNTKDDSFKLTVQNAVAEAKVPQKFKDKYTGFFNKLM